MSTLFQLINLKCRKKKTKYISTKALLGCPQKSAIIIKLYTTSLKNQIQLFEKLQKYVYLQEDKLLLEYLVVVILYV